MAALHPTLALASIMTRSSTTEGYGSFHLSHLSTVLPPRFPFTSWLVFVVFGCIGYIWLVLLFLLFCVFLS